MDLTAVQHNIRQSGVSLMCPVSHVRRGLAEPVHQRQRGLCMIGSTCHGLNTALLAALHPCMLNKHSSINSNVKAWRNHNLEVR